MNASTRRSRSLQQKVCNIPNSTYQQPTINSKKRKCEDHAERETAISKCKQETVEPEELNANKVVERHEVDDANEVCLCSRIPSNVIVTANWKRHHQQECLIYLSRRFSPLPILSWADPKEVWQIMIKKDSECIRDRHLMKRHPSLQARMRSILLDWLIEVCEVYRLHRETYYLSLDFIDRFLASQVNIPKQQLQLIGITCLFIAAKLEEIYPPKLSDFAYVTDEACTEKEILLQELVILKALQWKLTPVTVNNWLNIYMQLSNVENIENISDNFIFPQYSGLTFVKIAQLIDLCMLDVDCLQFPYRILAASALLHMTSPEVFHAVTGLELENVSSCVAWLQPFATTVREEGGTQNVKTFSQITTDDMHNIQTHSTNLDLLETAQSKQKQIKSLQFSPVSNCSTLLTPPQSNEKTTLTWS